MTLAKESRLVRWAYWMEDDKKVPERTTLCAFFWRAFFYSPLIVVAALVCVACLVVMLGRVAWWLIWYFNLVELAKFVRLMIAVVVLSVAVIGIVAGISFVAKKAAEPVKPLGRRLRDSVFMQGVKSIKSKFCPLIELE